MKTNLIDNTKDWLTSHDFFLKYRFRKRHIEGNKVFPPYVKLKDSSTHKYSLIYRDWQKIIETYFEIVVEEMMSGRDYEFPKRLGKLRLLRTKGSVKKRGVLYRNLHTNGFHPTIGWFRHKEADFKRKYWYKFNLSRARLWPKISKKLFEDPSIIYNFSLNEKEK